jgi:hypothetical protein
VRELDTSNPTGRLLAALIQGHVEVIEVYPAVGDRMTIIIGPGPNSVEVTEQFVGRLSEIEPELGGEG